jgi:hypothetical protein
MGIPIAHHLYFNYLFMVIFKRNYYRKNQEIIETYKKVDLLNIWEEMKSFFKFFIFKNPTQVNDFTKYFLSQNNWESCFIDTIEMFSFYNKDEIEEYKKYYQVLVDLNSKILWKK